MTTVYEAWSAVMGAVQGIGKNERVTEGPVVIRDVDAFSAKVRQITSLLVAAGVLVVPAPASDAAAVYRQIACAPGGEVVSQNFGSPTGGASRIDGPLGGTGWQCRTYTTSFTGYMRLASRRVGVPLKCEVWRGDLRMVWDERPTAVGCYVLPSQGSRS